MYHFSENDFLSVFSNKEAAQSNLRSISSDVSPTDCAFLPRLQFELSRNPVPDDILTGFERLTRSVINKSSFYKMLCDFPPIVARLVRIFTASRFLGELIIKDFQYTYFLIRPDLDCRPFDRASLMKSLDAVLRSESYSLKRKMDQLRILKRRELLKIGIRDYILDDPMEVTTDAVSQLADEFIGASLKLHFDQMCEKYGVPATPFTVIALGKLGGHELNYSSDVDLMFVYGDEGVLSQEGHDLSYHEFFNQVCQRLIASVSDNSPEGLLYRIDTRLRPDGDAGPLARSVSSFMHYYESRGRLWERQMLIKARPIAGDLAFGKEFLSRLTPFIYPRTFFESPLQEIAQMKWRIEEQKASSKLNIKICQGGIRDIEFIVQALQLVNGGRIPEIREGQTLRALAQLHIHQFLSEREYRTLLEAYVFYRKIEHILQIEYDRQTHSLSGETLQAARIAHLLGFPGTDAFSTRLHACLKEVRTIYDSVFETSQAEKNDVARPLSAEILDPSFESELQRAGFTMPANAFRLLKLLHFGQFPRLHPHTTQEHFTHLLPLILKKMPDAPDADHTLMNFGRIVSAYPATETLYKALIDRSDFLHSILQLSSYSHTFVNILCDNPSCLEYLITHIGEWMEEHRYEPAAEFANYKDLHVFRNMEFIKLALKLSHQRIGTDQLLKELSHLADHILESSFYDHFSTNDNAVLLGLGKLGGQELSFKSDLDVVFVCTDDADVDDMIAKGKSFLNAIAAITERGRLYEIDARLRPEGKQAPLVVTLSRYRDYFDQRAMFWERQALVKGRCLCGDPALMARLSETISNQVYANELSSDQVNAIITMRQRQIREKIKSPADALSDIKYSRGALLDLEYLVQALQMRYGAKYPSLRTQNTLDAVDALEKEGLLISSDAEKLRLNYLFLRNLEIFNFLAFERKSNKLPSDQKQLAFLQKFLKFNKDNPIVDHLSKIKNTNEALFSNLMRDLSYGKQ